jgi:hypothetical protein
MLLRQAGSPQVPDLPIDRLQPPAYNHLCVIAQKRATEREAGGFKAQAEAREPCRA